MRTCGFCGDLYDEATDVGLWRCGQHAAPRDPRTLEHPCCGETSRDAPQPYNREHACVPADHRPFASVPYTSQHDVILKDGRAFAIARANSRAIYRERSSEFVPAYVARRFADPNLRLVA